MMRAVVVDSHGDVSQAYVAEIPKPQIQPGEVLVQVYSAPVHPIDFKILPRGFGPMVPLNLIPGLECAGVVIECSAGTEHLLRKRVHLMRKGMWAEYVTAKPTELVELMEHVSLDQGATLMGNPATAVLFKEYILSGGHKAAVQNAANSALGKMMIRLCQRDGIPLINIVRSADKADQLRAMGAEYVLNSSDPQFLPDYKALGNRLGATIAFDAVAGEMTGKMLFGLCNSGIVYVFGNLSEQKSTGILASDTVFQSKRIAGFFLPLWIAEKSQSEKEAIFQEIQASISTIFHTNIAGHFSMEEVRAAVASYRANMSLGKVLIHPSTSS